MRRRSRILRPASEAGHPRAQNLLGAAHEHGPGLPRNGAEALRLYEASAAQGYPPAIFNLGVAFARGGPGIVPGIVAAFAGMRQ